MALHPISDNMDDLSQAEKVVAVLIDNQLISVLDAINVLKEIWNNDKKEKPITNILQDIPVAPHQKNPIVKDPTQPPWSPNTINPQRVWYEADHTGEKYPELPTQYSVKENPNDTTIAMNDYSSSITRDNIDNETYHVNATFKGLDRSNIEIPEMDLHESKVFRKG